MKQYILIIFLTLLIFSPICYAVQAYGNLSRMIITATTLEREKIDCVCDQQTYTSGGITFTYPANTFTNAPSVQVSIIQNTAHSTTQTYVAEVSANSISSTTVMVYLVDSGSISQASTGDVTVDLFAVDNPTS